jgi:hypothetical protein
MAASTPTLPDNKEDQDKKYDPSELKDKELGASASAGIDQAEAFANDPANHDAQDPTDGVGQAERDGTPNDPWNTTYGAGKKTSGGKVLSANNVRAILKKRGPLGLILTIGLGGGLFGTLLFSPGLLLVQMKESLMTRFNYQLQSMETRTSKILDFKISSQFTSGVCGKTISIKCKFSTISESQEARLKANGITIDEATATRLDGGRVKPGKLNFNGELIDAKDFKTRYNSADIKFRTAMRYAYSPKYAGFSDKIWSRVAGNIGLTKGPNLREGDKAAKDAGLQEDVKNGKQLTIPDDGITCTDSGCTDEKSGRALTDEEATAARNAKRIAIETAQAAGEAVENTAEREIAQIAEKTATAVPNTIANFVKVTGAADAACSVYTAVRGLGFAAKTVRALQLARYAMAFLNAADQIRNGTMKQEDMAYLGGILTSVAYDASGAIKRKAAMDSFGMQYASYGTIGKPNSFVSQFMAGGGLTGDLISITSYINNAGLGVPRQTCGTLSNGWVQLGSAAVGVVLLLIPGVDVAITVADVAKGIASAGAQIAITLLPVLLKDIVAGTVTKGIVGEDAGNAIASGSGTLFSSLAQAGGNAPLSVDDAVAYTNAQNETLAQYAADDRATLSMWDASSPNTFLGSIVSKLIPYTGQFASVGGSLSAVSNIVGGSFNSLFPKSSALSDTDLRTAYTTCTDDDYRNYLNIATDPFCNPVFGIPTQYLDKDPGVIIDELIGSDNLTTGGKPKGEYKTFIANCITRENPLGDDQGGTVDDGLGCKIDSEIKADFYLYQIDSRVNDGMDGYDTDTSTADDGKQALAQQIIDGGKVTFVEPLDNQIINDVASGANDGNTFPCGVNIGVLNIIAAIAADHTIVINDMNRACQNSTANGASSDLSRHFAGNGSAIDFGPIDGIASYSIRGAALIVQAASPFLVANSSVGQAGCGLDLVLPAGVNAISDVCNHLHVDIPPNVDVDLQCKAGVYFGGCDNAI